VPRFIKHEEDLVPKIVVRSDGGEVLEAMQDEALSSGRRRDA
jgi:hypothetical protein